MTRKQILLVLVLVIANLLLMGYAITWFVSRSNESPVALLAPTTPAPSPAQASATPLPSATSTPEWTATLVLPPSTSTPARALTVPSSGPTPSRTRQATGTVSNIGFTGAIPKSGTTSRTLYEAFSAFLRKDNAAMEKLFDPQAIRVCKMIYQSMVGCVQHYYEERGLKTLDSWHIKSRSDDDQFISIVSRWDKKEVDWIQVYSLVKDGGGWVILELERIDPEVRMETPAPTTQTGLITTGAVFTGEVPPAGTARRVVYDAFKAVLDGDEATLAQLLSSKKVKSCQDTFHSLTKCFGWNYSERGLQVLNSWTVQGTLFVDQNFEGVNLTTRWNDKEVEWVHLISVKREAGRWMIDEWQKIQPSGSK